MAATLPKQIMQRKQQQPQLVFCEAVFTEMSLYGGVLGENMEKCVDTEILESILSKYNHNLTIILITISIHYAVYTA